MSYFNRALDPLALKQAISEAVTALADVQFDAIAATGTSGLVFGPVLAYALGKPFIAIRKPGVDSHSDNMIESLGDHSSYLFVDDFISSGNTFRRAISAMTYKPIGVYLYQKTASFGVPVGFTSIQELETNFPRLWIIA
jgi:adenine/guanine phosphoribosyltransferase-like PRPP-binding protein